MNKHFQQDRLRDIADGDVDFEKEIIQLYIETCNQSLPNLEKALDEEDHEQSILLSHDLKGSSANVGAEIARGTCEKLERLCREGKLEEAKELLPQLKEDLEKTHNELDVYLNTL